MCSRCFALALAAGIVFAVSACSGGRSARPSQGSAAVPPQAAATAAVASRTGWLSAREAVQQAHAALNADWKEKAKLVFVGRYSQYAGETCSPYDFEADKGYSSDGRLEHWAVIFVAPPEASQAATVFCVRAGSGAELVKSGVMAFSGMAAFGLDDWVDSTQVRFRKPPVDLELRTNDDLAAVDPDVADHTVLWVAYTSAGHYDLYDGLTGEYIKSR
jgi:hypothetical protein